MARLTEARGAAWEEQLGEDRAALLAGRAGPPASPPPADGGRWVVALDAAKACFRDGWHEIKVGVVGRAAPTPRPGRAPGSWRAGAQGRGQSYIAHVGSMSGAAERVYAEVVRRGGDPSAQEVLCVGDGAPSIGQEFATHFPQRVEILDWYHAVEHLWAAGKGLYGEGTAPAGAWVAARKAELWAGEVGAVVRALAYILCNRAAKCPNYRVLRILPAGCTRFRLIVSPYDVEARFSMKRDFSWVGYKVHLTETCEETTLHVITHVETTAAPTPDEMMLAPIHAALHARNLVPAEHRVDNGYMDTPRLRAAREEYGMRLVGPVTEDHSWQAQAGAGYAAARFALDWEARHVTCPAGQRSKRWVANDNGTGQERVQVRFPTKICRACAGRAHCTTSARQGRVLTLRPQAE